MSRAPDHRSVVVRGPLRASVEPYRFFSIPPDAAFLASHPARLRACVRLLIGFLYSSWKTSWCPWPTSSPSSRVDQETPSRVRSGYWHTVIRSSRIGPVALYEGFPTLTRHPTGGPAHRC